MIKTNQEAFDIAAVHMLAQNETCTDINGRGCQYRAPLNDGSQGMCAVGALIPDELYIEDIEGESPKTLKTEYPNLYNSIFAPEVDVELLSVLQSVHDDHSPEDWKTQFEALGEDWDLDISIVKHVSEVSKHAEEAFTGNNRKYTPVELKKAYDSYTVTIEH